MFIFIGAILDGRRAELTGENWGALDTLSHQLVKTSVNKREVERKPTLHAIQWNGTVRETVANFIFSGLIQWFERIETHFIRSSRLTIDQVKMHIWKIDQMNLLVRRSDQLLSMQLIDFWDTPFYLISFFLRRERISGRIRYVLIVWSSYEEFTYYVSS